jgi:hypothetical protein
VIKFRDFSKNLIDSSVADAMMWANDAVYFVNNGSLIEITFEFFGKVIYRNKVVSTICPSYKVFPGIVVQDDFMKCHLAIPFARGLCANIHVRELDGFRVIDAKHERLTTVLVVEKGGNFYRYIVCFEENFLKYTLLVEQLSDFMALNFVSLDNGLNVLAEDHQIVLFMGSVRKEIKNTPVDSSKRLYHHGMNVYFVDDKKLYRIKMI